MKTTLTIKSQLLILSIAILTSCSFNKTFLHPTKLPANLERKVMEFPKDTVLVTFSGDTHQPTFIKNENDTVKFDYTIESVVFESANGNKLNGWLLKPKDIVPTITLVHFHGNSGFLVYQFQAITPLIKYGFQIFLFDYSGFGFSEGKATRKNVIIDANSALDYVKSRPDINNTKLIIYGQSLGGHLSAVVAEQRQADIDGLVMEGAFSSHKDIAAKFAGFIGRMFVSEKYCAFKSIRNFTKPVLIIHSTEDQVIPFEMGHKLFENANEPKEFYEIKECHICGPSFYADSISQKIKNMIPTN